MFTALRSAALRGAGATPAGCFSTNAATMMIWLWLLTLPMSGAASVAASLLGALLGRNCVLSLLTSLPSEGSAILEMTAMATQATITIQRNRTVKRPRPPKKRSVRPNLVVSPVTGLAVADMRELRGLREAQGPP